MPSLREELSFARRTYGIGGWGVFLLAVLPWASLIYFTAIQYLPATRGLAIRLLMEDGPVEWGTFIAAMVGGLWGLVVAFQSRRRGVRAISTAFYLLVAIGLLFFALEEISWAQRVIHFKTPEVMKEVNEQGEFNLHNLPILEHMEKWIILAVCLVGLATLRTSRRGDPLALRPSAVLAPLLLAILVTTLARLVSFYAPMGDLTDTVLDSIVEVVELLLACVGAAYVILNGRMLSRRGPNQTGG